MIYRYVSSFNAVIIIFFLMVIAQEQGCKYNSSLMFHNFTIAALV